MALIETEALILKTYNLSDADKIVVYLTQKRGLVRGVAKGAKRLKSKFGGSLEPFSIVQLTYIEKEERDLVSIEQVELVKSFFQEASEPYFLQQFAYLVDLLLDFAPPDEPNENLYNMAKACLTTGVENSKDLGGVTFYFEYWILRLGGYLPDWRTCRNCRRDFDGEEFADLQDDFDLLCPQCSETVRAQRISASSRSLFRSAQRLSPTDFLAFLRKNNAGDLIELSGVLKRIISRVLDKEIVEQRQHAANL